jgi:hypothetical protein
MRHGWIIDVLADLKTFAQGNNLPLLARHLEDTALIAAIETSQLVDVVVPRPDRDEPAMHLQRGASDRLT